METYFGLWFVGCSLAIKYLIKGISHYKLFESIASLCAIVYIDKNKINQLGQNPNS